MSKLMQDKSISIIIVTKNEEEKIKDCIESVFHSLDAYKNYEIILVDSASTDNTINIAKQYPIKIIQLKPQWFHSAAAGEYIGFLHATGDIICFIGGDMKLDINWFNESIPYLENEEIAGISGKIINTFENIDNCSSTLVKRITHGFESLKLGNVQVLGGPAMFKSDILKDVGGYHPFLKAGEEAELSYRIITKGYRLLRLPIPMVYHTIKCYSIPQYLFKYQWEYTKAVGSSIRYSLRTNKQIFLKRLHEMIAAMLINILFIFLIISFWLTLNGSSLFIYILFAIYFMLFVVIIYKKKTGVKDAMLSIIVIHLRALAKCIGFLQDLPDPSEYPTDVIILKS